MLKKLLLSTMVTLSLITTTTFAGERMAEDNTVEVHKECFMHPVLVGRDLKENPYTGKLYTINAYYDAITGHRINLEFETIYMDDEDNRWYFPYDDDKYHKHEGIRMSFEKGYEEEE